VWELKSVRESKRTFSSSLNLYNIYIYTQEYILRTRQRTARFLVRYAISFFFSFFWYSLDEKCVLRTVCFFVRNYYTEIHQYPSSSLFGPEFFVMIIGVLSTRIFITRQDSIFLRWCARRILFEFAYYVMLV